MEQAIITTAGQVRATAMEVWRSLAEARRWKDFITPWPGNQRYEHLYRARRQIELLTLQLENLRDAMERAGIQTELAVTVDPHLQYAPDLFDHPALRATAWDRVGTMQVRMLELVRQIEGLLNDA